MPPVLTFARWLRALACAFVLAAPSLAMAQTNLDFEQEASEAAPPGWRFSGAADQYGHLVSEAAAHEGRRGVEIAARVAEPSEFGGVMQSVDAAAYRGRRLRISAAAMSLGGAGHLWMRIDGADQRTLFFDNMADRPILAEDWGRYAIYADVPADAQAIAFGFFVTGAGAARVDDFRVADLGAAHVEAARALSPRGQANLAALARLYGAVRYFHPSDEAAAADWNALLHAGVARVERARNARELERALTEVFAPVAPSLRIASARARPPVARTPQAGDISWRHRGFVERGAHNFYSRTRVDAPDDLPAFTRLDLPDGLVAHVPVRLARDSHGRMLPAASTPLLEPPSLYSGDDRTARLAAVIQVWVVFKHFYPYFADVAVDWDAQLAAALGAASLDDDAAAFDLTLGAMTAPLQDGHIYIGRFGASPSGFPPLAWRWIEHALVVTGVGEGVEGVRIGDVVREIDGVAVEQLLSPLEARFSAATAARLRVRALRSLAAGDLGQSRVLALERDGRVLETPIVLTSLQNNHRLYQPVTQVIAELGPGVLYVDLTRLSSQEFRANLARFAAARGLVFDVRGYLEGDFTMLPHFADAPSESMQHLIRVAMAPDYVAVDNRQFTLQPRAPRLTESIVFITDARAMSRPESVLAIVAHHRLGAIVGEPTAGTTGDVTTMRTLTGHSITFTGMEVRNHDGSRFHGVGVQPTHPVSPTIDGVRAGRDEQLEAALELVRAQGLD